MRPPPRPDSDFHHFSRLPTELRLMIWRECLPHRVSEMDCPQPEYVFERNTPEPCGLQRTTTLNGLPPVITRVCRESHAVALETAITPSSYPPVPKQAEWGSSTMTCPWIGLARDSEHLNWSPNSEVEWGSTGNALQSLAWGAAHRFQGGSLMLESFAYSSHWGLSVPERIGILGRLPSWVVVTQTVVVHADLRTGAKTGLFGLLGDATVQVVVLSDEARVNTYYDLVEECGRKGSVAAPQCRASAESLRDLLKTSIVYYFGTEEALPPMKPAIMFRLRPDACNHRDEYADEVRRRKAEVRARGQMRGRGRGRGRGRA